MQHAEHGEGLKPRDKINLDENGSVGAYLP
jgi:hypothetical protein